MASSTLITVLKMLIGSSHADRIRLEIVFFVKTVISLVGLREWKKANLFLNKEEEKGGRVNNMKQ